ncbi:hypothetical protein ABZ896_11825 [Streptomyces sp. NPDC047072]|uniref:hypothetical protein n=1 Tax=Streptomyces sp. NPDC047072 TaxID=3154809 RepID=UPI0033C500DD
MRVDVAVRQLEKSLECLSWDASRQIDHVRGLGVGPDELALDFDDSFRVVSGMIAEGVIPDSLGGPLGSVDAILEDMTRTPEEKWSESAVRNSQVWCDLRVAARKALDVLRGLEVSGAIETT